MAVMRRKRGKGTIAQHKNGKHTALARTCVTQFRGLIIHRMFLRAVPEDAREL